MADDNLREEQEEIYAKIQSKNDNLEEQEQAQVKQAAIESQVHDASYENDQSKSALQGGQAMAAQNVVQVDQEDREVRKNRKKKSHKRKRAQDIDIND